jgi:hypothetical protein
MPVIRICSSGTYLLLSLGTMVSLGIEYSIRLFSADEALPVRLQAIGQLLRTGEGDEMAAGHLVGSNAQTFPHDPALKFHREEAVVAALQEPRRYIGPLP